jgi:hypothetical protein
MYGLGHLDFTPIFYGIIIFLGLLSMWHKLVKEKILALLVEVGVFILVFKLHGGSMAGGFAATVAALLAGFIFPFFIKEEQE